MISMIKGMNESFGDPYSYNRNACYTKEIEEMHAALVGCF